MNMTFVPFAERLAAVRKAMAAQDLGGFIVPRSDEHLGEYVPESAERLCWLTGFSGSAGVAVVLADRAAVFSDGRYTIQLGMETDPELFEQHHILKTPPPLWLATHAENARVGYDPKLFSEQALAAYVDAGVALVPVEENPLDAAWGTRPATPLNPVFPHPIEFAGETSGNKRRAIGDKLREEKQDLAVITDTASVAWLLNLRGDDIAHNPGVLGFALVDAEARVDLFIEPGKVTAETRSWLGNEVSVNPMASLDAALSGLSGRRVRVDPVNTPAWFAQRLRAAGAEVVAGADPCFVPKACKNAIEQEGARRAHRRDAVAMAKFLHFMAEAGPAGTETEMSAAEKLVTFRAEAPEFRGESFRAISSAGPNAALNHYKVSPKTNRAINPDELYLLDSGGQYPDGTTDVTRTLWTGRQQPPARLRDQYTRVLKGLISLDTLVFPEGTAGVHIDAFARRALWEAGLDFDHGTGHGVGSFLGVHEGPASISKPLRPDPLGVGMLMSNEPGYYVAGEYGIRLENLMFVLEADLPGARTRFLRFESITLVPFERRLIETEMLTASEREWIDRYHREVERTVAPEFEEAVRAWLEENCAPL